MIGAGADSQIGTARKAVIAPHYIPGHWCRATTDLDNKRLVYYDPFYDDPHRDGALNTMDAYVDQVSFEQGAKVAIGADTFESKVHNSPSQPDNVRCGVCVLVEAERITNGEIDSRRDRKFDAAGLLRCRAKWACELMTNPAPTPDWSPTTAAGGGGAARATTGVMALEHTAGAPLERTVSACWTQPPRPSSDTSKMHCVHCRDRAKPPGRKTARS